MANHSVRYAVFSDRDGVLNIESGFISNPVEDAFYYCAYLSPPYRERQPRIYRRRGANRMLE